MANQKVATLICVEVPTVKFAETKYILNIACVGLAKFKKEDKQLI